MPRIEPPLCHPSRFAFGEKFGSWIITTLCIHSGLFHNYFVQSNYFLLGCSTRHCLTQNLFLLLWKFLYLFFHGIIISGTDTNLSLYANGNILYVSMFYVVFLQFYQQKVVSFSVYKINLIHIKVNSTYSVLWLWNSSSLTIPLNLAPLSLSIWELILFILCLYCFQKKACHPLVMICISSLEVGLFPFLINWQY